MPEDDARRTDWLGKVAGWIGGLTAILLALAGLKAAYDKLFTTPDPPKPPVVTSVDVPVKPKPAALPTSYSKPAGVLKKEGDDWFETDTKAGAVIRFTERSRSGGQTEIYDDGRDLYLKWPTQGGIVQYMIPNKVPWTPLYDAVPN